jgi:hypothetical protein
VGGDSRFAGVSYTRDECYIDKRDLGIKHGAEPARSKPAPFIHWWFTSALRASIVRYGD